MDWVTEVVAKLSGCYRRSQKADQNLLSRDEFYLLVLKPSPEVSDEQTNPHLVLVSKIEPQQLQYHEQENHAPINQILNLLRSNHLRRFVLLFLSLQQEFCTQDYRQEHVEF